MKDVVPYDLFAILLYSERQHGLGIRYSIGHREEVVRNLVIPLGEGITGIAAREPPAGSVGRRSQRSALSDGSGCRPVRTGRSDADARQAGGRHRSAVHAAGRLSRAGSRLLQLIASRVAVSIDNARLYRRVDRQNRTLKTLAHLSQEFSSILDLDELLRKIATTTHSLVAFDAFSILLLDAERKVLRHRFSERYDQRVDLDNIPLGKGLTGAAAESREIVRVADTLADQRYIASHPDIRSEIAVPLIVQDRVVGVMNLESERMGYFTEEHARLLALLAPQIASSVENARLYEEIAQREQWMDRDLKAARNVQSVMLPRERRKSKGWTSPFVFARRAKSPATSTISSSTARRNRLPVWRRQRQRRGRGPVRRHGQRPAAYAGAPPARSGRIAEAAEPRPARAHRRYAIRRAAGAGVGERACIASSWPTPAPSRRSSAAVGPSSSPKWKVFRPACSTIASTTR